MHRKSDSRPTYPDSLEEARRHAREMPLDALDVSDWSLFRNDTLWPYFERLRNEDPVHFHPDGWAGPYWSVTGFHDIKAVEANHEVFSSRLNITIVDQPEDFLTPSFIAMDPPEHDVQRKAVNPVVWPRNLMRLEPIIRDNVTEILDGLPVGETFDWVDTVSIELTTRMLATLFDFPFEERRKLTRWSDVATGGPETGLVADQAQRRAELRECLEVFTRLRDRRIGNEDGIDLISMLARSEATRDMPPMELLGNLLLLIVGGNDTTRNSISGGVLALNRFPEQYDKLRQRPDLIGNMVSEIIRWQTPLAHMRRTALEDVELRGRKIGKGDKVVMWYVSGNRDGEVFDRADEFIIDRANARRHIAFGYGIHRCMGSRLAEMQLRILWEELLARFHVVEVVGAPKRTRSNFVRGYTELPVVLHPAG